MQFQWKLNLNVYLIRIAFFAFLLPFFEAFGEIIGAFQLHILREELIIYKTQSFWKLNCKSRSNQTKGLKNTIFLFYHF